MRNGLSLAATVVVVTLSPGCGGTSAGTISARETAAAEQTAGDSAYASRDYAGAATHFEASINSGGLNPDAYCDAAIKLVICYGSTAKYDEAMNLLETLERGAPNLDQVFAARAFVLKKQGKSTEANAAMAQARRYNRGVKEFK